MCPKLPWRPMGSFTQARSSLRRGGPGSTACPPRPLSWGHSRAAPNVPTCLSWRISALPRGVWLRRCKVRCGKGCYGLPGPCWKCLGCCHQDPALLSPVQSHAKSLVMTLIVPRTRWLILDIKLLWSFSKPLFWDSHWHGLPSGPHRLLCWHCDKGWANNPPTKRSTNRGPELGCAGSVCANLVVTSAFLSFCPFPASGPVVY